MVKGFSLAQGQSQFQCSGINVWQRSSYGCNSPKFYLPKFAATRARYTMAPSNYSFKAGGFAAA